MKLIKSKINREGKAYSKVVRIFGVNIYSFCRVGDVSLVRLLGVNVFMQVGYMKSLLGVTYGSNTR